MTESNPHPYQPSTAARIVDGLLEAAIAPSFTNVGYAVRSRLSRWPSATSYDLSQRVIVLTGATSGLGLAALGTLVGCGATVYAVGRDRAKTDACVATVNRARSEGPPGRAVAAYADLGELGAVRDLAARLRDEVARVDVLVHNAGALTGQRQLTSLGIEATVASQVLGPFLLTSLMQTMLAADSGVSGPGRVLTMSSGGMYGAALMVEGLQMSAGEYNGTKQYALAKRAQVTLNEMWAQRVDPSTCVFHALHPGWADTPGVAMSLPLFGRVMRPLLRDADQGADTLCWLAAADEPLASSGKFWHDRQTRPIHRLPNTRRSDTPERRQRLWAWCEALAAEHYA